MNTPPEKNSAAAPDPTQEADAVYTLDIVAGLTGLSSQTILHYHEQGLVSPVPESGSEVLQFDDEALRTLRRIEHLRSTCEMNESGLRLVLGLLDEVERLRTGSRSRA